MFAWRYSSGVQNQGPEHRDVLFCDQPARVAVCSHVVIRNWETPGAVDDSCWRSAQPTCNVTVYLWEQTSCARKPDWFASSAHRAGSVDLWLPYVLTDDGELRFGRC